MTQAPSQSNPLRLLCFDGGGVRGLASLCMLRQILSYVGNPKPCEYFDMIAGTSTGGLIAIMLGRLEMGVDDAIRAYCTMMEDIFKKKNRVRINPFTAKAVPKYDAKILKDKICKIIEANGESSGAKFRSNPPKRCRTFVVAKQTQPSCTVYFTDWERLAEANDMYNQATIWEAALSTTAASTFFKPASIVFDKVTYTFVDGGLGQNNPVDSLYDLARELFIRQPPGSFDEDLRVILSIGTGVPPAHDVTESVSSLVNELIKLASGTQETHNAFIRRVKGTSLENKYIRFNPPDLMSQVKLDDYNDSAKIWGMVVRYAQEEDTKKLFTAFKAIAHVEQPTLDLRWIGSEESIQWIPDQPLPYSLWSSLSTDERWIDVSGNSYWNRMTEKSFAVYERIYEACEKKNGCVHYRSFHSQLPPNTWASQSLQRIWSRLYRPRGEMPAGPYFGKGFVLAVAYMLHVEQIWPGFTPTGDFDRPGAVKDARRNNLKRWPNWIPCRCTITCRTEWNFANESGLVRNVGNPRQCETMRWKNASQIQRKLSPSGGKRYEDLERAWNAMHWTPDA